MNIIFGDIPQPVADRYTVLELDLVRFMPANQCVQAWCVVETVPMEELGRMDSNRKMHQDLMAQYRQRNWAFCGQAITALLGQWNGELDTFYHHLLNRVSEYQLNPPAAEWDGALIKFESVPDSQADSVAE